MLNFIMAAIMTLSVIVLLTLAATVLSVVLNENEKTIPLGV